MGKNNLNNSFELDRFDIAILDILQNDNKTPHRTIAEMVHLSAASIQRRIKKMEDAGIIQQNIAVINAQMTGNPISLIVKVSLEQERIDLINQAKTSFISLPQVQQCYYVTGEVDFILVIIVQSMEEYEKLTKRLFFNNSNIKRFNTFVVMDKVKVGLSVNL
jgi:Lrp/AsnC family leucine-responsive transcriptional regulator